MNEDKNTKKILDDYKNQLGEEQKKREAEMQLDLMVSRILEPEARERLSNVKLVNKQLYLAVSSHLVRLSLAGKLGSKLGEQGLKELLLRFQPKKRNIKITRK